MIYTRRHALTFGAATLAGLGMTTIMPFAARAQEGEMEGDSYDTDNGKIVVHPVAHASMVLAVPGTVIYVDPVGGAAAYEGLPEPDLILITHEHGDHYDAETLAAIGGDDARLITNPAVFEMLPEELKARAGAIGNGESTSAGDIKIDAIPAYNTTEERKQYHPQGRDNGYVLSIDGKTVYIAGDTEDIPEMRALTGIDIAFLPMNLPYTMDVAQAASAVGAFAPAIVYPYHYRGSDIDEFERLVEEEDAGSEVVRGDWYPEA